MEVRQQRILPAWISFALVVLGFLTFLVSYFVLPVYVITPCCGQSAYAPTTWAYSLTFLADLSSSTVINVCILALCYVPLLVAVTVVGCLLGFLVQPRRTFMAWSYRVWLMGSIALILLLLVLLFGVAFFSGRPDVGLFGLLVGYGLLWLGDRVARNSVSSA